MYSLNGRSGDEQDWLHYASDHDLPVTRVTDDNDQSISRGDYCQRVETQSRNAKNCQSPNDDEGGDNDHPSLARGQPEAIANDRFPNAILKVVRHWSNQLPLLNIRANTNHKLVRVTAFLSHYPLISRRQVKWQSDSAEI